MEIFKIQENELNQARILQKKCVDLHLPSPPVVLWDATILDVKGNEKHQTIAKANSYVRNALNVLSYFVGMASPSIRGLNSFKDGLVNVKDANGIIYPVSNIGLNGSFVISLGDSTSPTLETLDHYLIPSQSGRWNNGGTLHYSNFDEKTRTLVTQFITVLVNTNATSTQYVSEAAVYMNTGSMYFLMLRDIFTPIAVGPGESIRFVYQTEVLYPL